MNTPLRFIWITFRKEGIHKYPDALSNKKLKSVSFLGNAHRHVFHFKVSIEVFHNDRDLEFIIEKRWMENLYNKTLDLNNKSCEMIAEDLYSKLKTRYGKERRIKIEVSEDGENGCSLEWSAQSSL